jgi:7,8-dihydroneopterin aldolase/epimerase/oxygenase
MTGTIKVKGIKQYCYHGCLPEEEKIGGWYETDVEAETNMDGAVKTDDLSKTADYAQINEIVRNEMSIRSRLVEHVAGRIASALLKQIPRIDSVAVTVSKLRPPVEGEVDRFSVSIKMKRTN